MSKENYLKDLFIDEAKPALKRHSGGGGSGSSDLIECESLPTAGVQEGKIYRARWGETVEIPPGIEIWVTDGDGSEPYTFTVEEMLGGPVTLIVVDSIDEIASEPTDAPLIVYCCNADGILYLSQDLSLTDMMEMPREVNAGFIGSPDELDVNKSQLGLIKVDSEIVTTNYEQIGISSTDANVEFVIRDNTSWKTITPLQKYIDALGVSTLFRTQKNMVTAAGLIEYSDTSNVTSMCDMFRGCSALTEVPLLDTSNVTDMTNMFYQCSSLTEVPLFDTSKVTDMKYMFYVCSSLTEVPLFDTSKVTDMKYMFSNCPSLTTVPALDVRNVTTMYAMLYDCKALTECWLRNIKTALQVGSGTSYGHLLTVESLTHLIYELRDTGSSNTLTVGSANLAKLASVYVKTVEITDEMRAADDLVDEKLPFVVCESTDEGAMLITDYANFKNWQIA